MNDKGCAQRDVLKKLIQMAQEMMMEGMGDDESAGNAISEAMKDGEMVAEGGGGGEVAESGGEMIAESGEPEADDFDDYRKKEMKRGLKSPIKDRKVAVMVAQRPQASAPRKGRA